eukprot:Gb_18830 [translate_table: standard]
MDGAYSRSRSKRPHFEQNPVEDNELQYKRYQPSYPPSMMPKFAPGETVFRILCPEAKAGGVIGKGGSIISQMRQETGARITVQETVEGSEERVIVISALEEPRDRDNNNRNNNGRDDDDGKLSPAQQALLKVHARIVEGGSVNGDVDDNDPDRVITTRLVVPNSQVGCLLGKGGKIIEQMREETKAQIRILPRDQTPLCTNLSSDEILQIVGELNVVKKALRIISTRLKDSPPKERAQPPLPHSSVYSPDRRAPPADAFIPYQNSTSRRANLDGPVSGVRASVGFSRGSGPALGSSSSGHTLSEGGSSHLSDHGPSSSGEELVFRVLCPNKKIGSVIGRGGSIIKNLREEIGVKIKVTDSVPGSDDRIIIISSNEVPDDNLSPAQEALLHIQSQIVDLGPDKDGVITTRLLVPANHVGCLIGKGGSVISEMRRATGANIRILPREDLPPCALDTDELVQIVGDIRVAREALVQITSRLRSSLHRERPFSGHMLSSSLGSPTRLSSRGRLEPGSPGRSFSSARALRGGGHSSSSHQNLPSSPGPWSSKSKRDMSSGGNFSDFEDLSSHQGGSAGFGRAASGLITKTTVEVVIPQHAIAAIVGKSGNGIVRIRQFSGAKVNLLEVRPGSSEGVVEISGTPEQTHAAQCLIEASICNNKPLFG